MVPVLTAAGAEFVTPLTVSALAGEPVDTGALRPDRRGRDGPHRALAQRRPRGRGARHRRPDRQARRTASPTTSPARCSLATDKRVLLAPAMNVRMWQHPATQRNLATVIADGALVVGPDEGEMACGEFGPGRMAEPPAILAAIEAALAPGAARRPPRARHLRPDPRADRPGALHRQPLLRPPGQRHRRGARPPRRARHLRHRPGRGAAARRRRPSSRSRPPAEMLAAVEAALPADVAVFAAAVADWRVTSASGSKVKKDASGTPAGARARARTPTSCKTIAGARRRPPARSSSASPPRPTTSSPTPPPSGSARAPTGSSPTTSAPRTGIMGGTENAVTLITAAGAEPWPRHVEGRHRRARSPTASPRRWHDRRRRHPPPAAPRPGAAAAGLRHRRRRRHGPLRQPRARGPRRRA